MKKTGKMTFPSRYHPLSENREARKQTEYIHSFKNTKTKECKPWGSYNVPCIGKRTVKKNQHYSHGTDSLRMGYKLGNQGLHLGTWKDGGKTEVGKVGWSSL